MMRPSIFVSHGAPTLPFEHCPARDFLRGLGQTLGRPRAILIASAHWDTQTPQAGGAALNATLHDFQGFPQALYDLDYPAPGDPALAADVAALTGGEVDAGHGLDHGAWVPLLLMYPDADIPVVQLSVQSALGAGHHIALGRTLARLREDDVLVMGSGGLVHNLRLLDRRGPDAGPEPVWSSEFSSWMDDKLTARDETALADYRRLAPHAVTAQPTEDHFMPLFVAYGAGGDKTTRLHSSATYGSLRMDAYAFG
jgi:4,5-DOPA dioxygenase extradiol